MPKPSSQIPTLQRNVPFFSQHPTYFLYTLWSPFPSPHFTICCLNEMGTKKIQSLRTHNQEKYGKQLPGLSLIFLYFFFSCFFLLFLCLSHSSCSHKEWERNYTQWAIFQLVLCCNVMNVGFLKLVKFWWHCLWF